MTAGPLPQAATLVPTPRLEPETPQTPRKGRAAGVAPTALECCSPRVEARGALRHHLATTTAEAGRPDPAPSAAEITTYCAPVPGRIFEHKLLMPPGPLLSDGKSGGHA